MIAFPELPEGRWGAYNALISERLQFDLGLNEGAGSMEDLYRERCPEWSLFERREECVQVLPRLELMARDEYRHDLDALQSYVLYQSLAVWSELEMVRDDDGPGGAMAIVLDLLENGFEDLDFQDAATYANDLLQGGQLVFEIDVHIRSLLGVMPSDIAKRIEDALLKGTK